MNRVVIQEGYTLPFAGYKKKRRASKRRSSSRGKRQQSKMKVCARKWKSSGKRGKYTSFMRGCLKK